MDGAAPRFVASCTSTGLATLDSCLPAAAATAAAATFHINDRLAKRYVVGVLLACVLAMSMQRLGDSPSTLHLGQCHCCSLTPALCVLLSALYYND
jgi:hypothetical protein